MNPITPVTTAHNTMTPYTVDAADGIALQAYAWEPRQGTARASLVVIHGLRDHASRYAALADAMSAKGIATIAQDHRGHGRSSGARQYFDSISQLVADVHLAVLEAKKRRPDQPVFLYGHSLGGLVATHYTLEHPGVVKGVVLSGPALKLLPGVSGIQQGLARFFGTILPSLPAQPVDDTEFVRDPSAKAALASNPLIVHANLPARSAKAGLEGIEAIQKHMEAVVVPFLVMHGTMDKATNIEGSRELHTRARSEDKTFEPLENLYHDLLHEPERDAVIAEATNWVMARLR
jgi:acylglycerol lipase